MRILVTTDTVGGVWTYTSELTAGMLQKGVAVALAIIGPAPSAAQVRWLDQTAERWGNDFLWEVAEVPLEWMSKNERAYLDAESLLLRMAKEFRIDLLHTNQFCFGALPLSVPRLVVAHSDVLSWATACGEGFEAWSWLDRYCNLVTAGLSHADAVVAPTHWMLDALAKSFHFPCPSYVVANGRTLPAERPHSGRKFQAVTAGRLWDEAKNLKMLAKVHSPFPLLVAGEYRSSVLPALPPGTMMLGPLAEEDLLSLFRQSAIYLCTSRYEPFGLAPLEAALCGCAIVANDIPSLREVWGRGALYFQNAATLSERLAELANHPQQLLAAQRRSRRRAQRYTASRMTDQYLFLYQTMLTKLEASIVA